MPAVLWPGTAACHEGTHAMTSFTTQHDRTAEQLVLPFPAPPARRGGSVYRNHLFGLKLEAVVADGQSVPGVETLILLDDIDLRPVAAPGDAHVYLVAANRADEHGTADADAGGLARTDAGASGGVWSLLAVSAMTEDGFEMREFSIPRNAERIQVRYRVRDPATEELGPELTLGSTASDS